MASWQRRARFGIGGFALILVGVLGLNLKERAQPAKAPQLARIDPKATIETHGGEVIQLKAAKQDIRIEFEGQVSYDNGESKLLGVKAFIDNRSGRSFTISGKEGQVGKDQSTIDVTGDVVLQTSDGLTAKSDQAHYVKSEGIVRAPGPVAFTRGRMSGTGVGFTYDEQRDTLWLLDQAKVHFAPQGDLTEMNVISGAFGFARAERYMKFERGVTLVRQGQTVKSDDGIAHLLADRDEPDLIELHGHSSIVGGTGTGTLQNMQASDMNLDYAEDGQTLQHVVLAGQSNIVLANTDGSLGQTLSGEFIDVVLAADGAVTALTSRDHARVALPASGETPGRVITAPTLTGTGAPGQGLTGMHFEGGVDFREAASKTTQPRAARARTLDVQLAPSTGVLQDARFNGQFRFEEGTTVASSAVARYDVTKGHLALSGGDASSLPQLEDDKLIIRSTSIDVTLDPRVIDAVGDVRGQMRPSTGKDTHGPSLLKATEPAFIAAERLRFEEATGQGTYTGKARLFQGDTVINAETITMDDKKGDMTAVGKVQSQLPLVPDPNAPPEQKQRATLARGEEFKYVEDTRRATYSKNAQMDGPEGNVRGERIELRLDEKENQLKQLDAEGGVKVLVDTREASGVKLTYLPDDAQYVMVGVPVVMLENCRETKGKTLKFFRGSDRILIDGNEQQRTESKGGGKCPEPR